MEQISLKKYLISHGIISEKEYAGLLAGVNKVNSEGLYIKKTLGEALCEKQLITEKRLCEIYSAITGFRMENSDSLEPERNITKLIKGKHSRDDGVIPLRVKGSDLYVLMKDPTDLMAIQRLRQNTGKSIKPLIGYPSAIDALIIKIYGEEIADKALVEMSNTLEEESPEISETSLIIDSGTIRFVNSILDLAIERGASDIHIEPWERESVTRIRVDGLLQEIKRTSIQLHPSIIARIKVMAGMDVAEKRIPQDGRINYSNSKKGIDLRISTLPTIFGEKAVIRILQKNEELTSKSSIGLDEENLKSYENLLKKSSGLILIVGPTGSGKSTTMVTMEKILNKPDVNIVTLEDPVEYNIPGLSQVQINEKTGMTFAKGLKAIMRQDPDVICVGEIRDEETAEIAMRAAITGHLVISTLHTNDAVSAFERLIDMGVPPFLVSSSIVGIISQRLVRNICKECKTLVPVSEEELNLRNNKNIIGGSYGLYRGTGCSVCNGSGYRGRSGVFEILVVNDELRNAVSSGKNYSDIREAADKTGYIKLRENCIRKIISGETTVDEMNRVLNLVE